MAKEDPEDRTILQRGKERLKDVTRAGKKGVRKAADTFTGKGLEDGIADYTDLYTQVLLGIHRDVEAHATTLNDLESAIKSMPTELELQAQVKRLTYLEAEIGGLRDRFQVVRMIALVALAVALIAVVGMIWTAI